MKRILALVAALALGGCGLDWHKLLAQGNACAAQIAAGALDGLIGALASSVAVQIGGGDGFNSAAWEATLSGLGAKAGWSAVQCAAADLLDDVSNPPKVAITGAAFPVPTTWCRRGRVHSAVEPAAVPYLLHVLKMKPPAKR